MLYGKQAADTVSILIIDHPLNPGYPTYKSAVKIAGGNVVEYTLTKANDWYPDFAALEKTDLQKVKLMFVNYPQMPTGQLPTKKLFEELSEIDKAISKLTEKSGYLTEGEQNLLERLKEERDLKLR